MDLFSNYELNNKPIKPTINGLTYLENFITQDQERQLIAIIDEQLWLDDLKRRKTHRSIALLRNSICSSHSKRNSKSLLVKIVFPFRETNSYL